MDRIGTVSSDSTDAGLTCKQVAALPKLVASPTMAEDARLAEIPLDEGNLKLRNEARAAEMLREQYAWPVTAKCVLPCNGRFNTSVTTETALIETLPRQIIAVERHMLELPGLWFLLADDAGAGKTIMVRLYVWKMLNLRWNWRVLVAPPAGLVDS
jgi:hypothetical protein